MNSLYFKRLDSLRFFAFFLVFWSHSKFYLGSLFTPGTGIIKYAITSLTDDTGVHGVALFFVLSGFLITLLLIKEQEATGTIGVKSFYIRRVLRIWPVYYLVMVLSIFILPRLSHSFPFCGNAFLNLFFLNNFDMDNIKCYSPNLTVSWSVAIEEQFYLVWPLLFAAFYKRNILPYVCAILWGISTVYVLLYPKAHFQTLANINYLMAGCLGAILYSKNPGHKFFAWLGRSSTYFALIVLAILYHFLPRMNEYLGDLARTTTCLVYLCLVIPLVKNSEKANPVFSYLGKYTYGMYFYHATFIYVGKLLFDKLGINYATSLGNDLILFALSMAVTIAVSILSYNYFEMYFLAYKRKFEAVKTRI